MARFQQTVHLASQGQRGQVGSFIRNKIVRAGGELSACTEGGRYSGRVPVKPAQKRMLRLSRPLHTINTSLLL